MALARLPLDRLDEAVLAIAARMEEAQAAAGEQALRADRLERQVVELERQLAIAEAKLAVETMHSAGLAAQASHLLAVAVEADVFALPELLGEPRNGEQKNEGAPKGRLAQIYDAAFDAKGADLGIEEPGRFREA
ncbi:hypothetical protein [Roseomonas populi]|uniref:Uncharacterized protein n=1 Tax=Roseomonas populi TaxID=3121582 RepID=A0ABT1X357_9PROT|nr:hypothetical protein [Roseomonas pecuniae]MCR0982538.1 hypothetical protein [Roseomonas pecuniae]